MKLSREKIQRMIDGRGNSGGTGGGGGEGAGGVSQAWVESNFVSIAYFTRLIKAYGPGATASDPDVEVVPNDVDSTITSIKAMFGLWTEQFISALGQGTGGSGSATSLADLVDVQINTSTLAQGQALLYDGNGHWYNGTLQGGGISMSDVWTALAANTNEQINASHLQGLFTDLSNTNNNQISMTIGDTTRALTVGYASAANIANHVYCTTHIGSWQLSIDYDEISHFWLTGKYNDLTLPCAVDYATYAGRLKTARTIWGQSFDGSGNIEGSIVTTTRGNIIGFEALELNSLGTLSGYGGYIDFHFNGAQSDYTSRIIEDASGQITINAATHTNSLYTSGTLISNGNITGNSNLTVSGNITGNSNLTVSGLGTFGNVLSNGYVTALSDVRLKRVLGHVELTAEKIAKASTIRFAWKGGHDKREHVGGIAQEWQELLPQAVVDVDGRLSMDYSAIAYVSVVSLAKKVVAQQREIDSLKAENAKLEKRLERLEKMFAITGDEEE